jgi:hypothetical protein
MAKRTDLFSVLEPRVVSVATLEHAFDIFSHMFNLTTPSGWAGAYDEHRVFRGIPVEGMDMETITVFNSLLQKMEEAMGSLTVEQECAMRDDWYSFDPFEDEKFDSYQTAVYKHGCEG